MRSRANDRGNAYHDKFNTDSRNSNNDYPEKNSKYDKVYEKKLKDRSKIINYYLPRFCCCLLLLLFCIGISYRLTDRVIRHKSSSDINALNVHLSKENNLNKVKSRYLSLLKNLHNKTIVSKEGQSIHLITDHEKIRMNNHVKHIKEHGNLLDAAKAKRSHQLGPRIPYNHRGEKLSELEKQGKFL
jgi:hypothetical protein